MGFKLWLAVCMLCSGCVSAQEAELKAKLQEMLNGLAEKRPYKMQLGWKGAGMEFSLAAGGCSVEDTFLSGSGTKPFTATAVIKLAEAGKLSLDDKAHIHLDPVLQALNHTTLEGLFGPNSTFVTVRHILAMQSGIQDFDFPQFDSTVLANGNAVHSPVEFVVQASQQTPKMLCFPGDCVVYSSTNFILAGLILLGKSGTMDWTTLDQKAYFPQKTQINDMQHSSFYTNQPLQPNLTTPGMSKMDNNTIVPIMTQNSSILGYTCGNLVAPSLDVARFFWDLVGPGADMVTPAYLEQMKQFKPLSQGWAKGRIQYGLGLMIQSVALNTKNPPTLDQPGTYVGHGGDTYGFLSEQGYYPYLNASIAMASNQDYEGYFVQLIMACRTVNIASEVLYGKPAGLRCFPLPPTPNNVV